jgi:hypothetical protein
MSERRREKLAEKFKEKQNWKAENLGLLNRAKKAEASVKDLTEKLEKAEKKIDEMDRVIEAMKTAEKAEVK